MKLSVFFACLLAAGAAAPLARAQDDGPRQLGAPPTVPTPAPRRAAVPAPAAPAPAAALPADSAVRQTVSQPAAAPTPGPATAPTPVYAPTPAGQLPGGSSRPTRFQVGLKSGMVYNVYSVEQHSPIFGHSYLLLDGQRKIDFSDVGFYEDETGHYVRTTLPNSSRETTFRRDRTGRISLYSTLSSSYSPGYGGYGLGGFGGYGGGYGGYPGGGYGGYPYNNGYRTTKTEYFSKDNGPIQSLNYRNLALATRDNAGAQELLAQGRHYQTAITAAYVVGGGLLLAGVLQSLQSNNGQQSISPLLYAGIPILIVPIVLQGKQAASQRQAIALYNGTPGTR
ncbi:hypothetical protein ACFQ48_11235 [Hymenobacter caeli]|uniref:Uncharacterized protein n=1 Tax=Hymenobacter caeli TaxID=2735894 RepID=A0ABX2FSN7_9BACT|nr:hypothetical protein [Hymenobacter caeli]NRT19863.1 hypothetical protein [Hymenobacter caeli]